MRRAVGSPGDGDLLAQTIRHYDAYPFEFLSPADEAAIATIQPPPSRRFVDECIGAGNRVADIGCGPGRATSLLTRAKADVVAVDVSHRALILARRRAPGAGFVRATNLALPFCDGAFDAVVSDGVAHHTADCRAAFAENARILKTGGVYYFGV